MKESQNFEAIRKLICLGFYARNNLNYFNYFLGKYKYNEKEYDVYFSINGESSIFIKCGDESFFLMVEDKETVEYINGPLKNDVILHINKYKNTDINDINQSNITPIPKEKLVYESEISLDYLLYSSCLYNNPNKICQDELEEKRYIFNEPESFDTFTGDFVPKMDGVFSPEIIIDIINQIYSNFKQIYLDNKISGIIDSLTPEELMFLRDKLHKKIMGTFKNVSDYYYNQEQKSIDNAIQTLKRIKQKQDM